MIRGFTLCFVLAVSQLIEMLSFAHHVEEGAILMILKPLEIEGRKINGFRQLKMQSR